MTAPAYRKTQSATVILALFGVAIAGASLLAVLVNPWLWLAALVLGTAAYIFSSLTVRVDEDRVQWSFGPGVVRKSVLLADIAGARRVRNRWWYGWGIRYTPHGWLYNVSGLEAVELDLTSGKTVRIGSDEPERLCAAIRAGQARSKHAGRKER